MKSLPVLDDNQIQTLTLIVQERLRQEKLKKEGRFKHSLADVPGLTDPEKLAILMEEVGEVARAVSEARGNVNDKHNNDLLDELTQVAALCMAWMEAL